MVELSSTAANKALNLTKSAWLTMVRPSQVSAVFARRDTDHRRLVACVRKAYDSSSHTMPDRLVVFVDVDDTLVRSVGTKRIPMPGVVGSIRRLAAEGADLYAWSSGGAAYAEASVRELGIAECFSAFLPKPHVVIDDQAPHEWRRMIHIYPTDAQSRSVPELRAAYDSAGEQ